MNTFTDRPIAVIDSLIAVQSAIVRFNERYFLYGAEGLTPIAEERERFFKNEWEGLDLEDVKEKLVQARIAIDLLTGEESS